MRRPNIIILLADDLGWGQVGYNGHPYAETPNIDALAANGLRFDRFYSSGPDCSPTRAASLTGRAGDRCGVPDPFYRLRLQEKTIAQALKAAGYRNKHFGKWHLNGMIGSPGAPMFPEDTHHPGRFGFDEWFSNTCNINPNTLMGHHTGEITENPADSSSAIADNVNEFMESANQNDQPFFACAWFSAPHGPLEPLPASQARYEGLGLLEVTEKQLGLIYELDQAVGSIRDKLRLLGIENETVVWFCSDNGGLPNTDPDAVGHLNGQKSTMYEGGLRVPCAVEWPNRIQPGVTQQLAYTSDIPLTLCELSEANPRRLTKPQDGVSICPVLLEGDSIDNRALPFHGTDEGALITDRWKILTGKVCGEAVWDLYDIQTDPSETTDLSVHHPDIVATLQGYYWDWYSSVRKSVNGLDYPEGRVAGDYPLFLHFFNAPMYADYVDDWKTRPEYVIPYSFSMVVWEPGDPFYEAYCF